VSSEPTFESAQRELEQIVQRLESGETGLDEAIALWERGEELYRFCLGKLDSAQGKIEQLASRGHEALARDADQKAVPASPVRPSKPG
jgi:exodeoxyribonuclease VII small subunit